MHGKGSALVGRAGLARGRAGSDHLAQGYEKLGFDVYGGTGRRWAPRNNSLAPASARNAPLADCDRGAVPPPSPLRPPGESGRCGRARDGRRDRDAEWPGRVFVRAERAAAVDAAIDAAAETAATLKASSETPLTAVGALRKELQQLLTVKEGGAVCRARCWQLLHPAGDDASHYS